jgi:arylsulfatase
MFGNRAVYSDGWVAATRHGRLPWENIGTYDFDKDKWELYRIDTDFSEANDMAAQEPQRLRDLQDLFWVEAAKYQVLPLDDRFIERADPSLRPSLIAGRTDFTYYPGAVRIPESSSPYVKNRSHSITAYVEVPPPGGDGVLVAAGGTVGGYVLYVKDGKPAYEYNWFSQQRTKIESAEKLPAGPATIRMEFKYDGGGVGKGGLVTLFINGKKVGEGRVEKTILGRYSADETFDIGRDTGSPVSDDYKSPNPYKGTLRKVEIHLEPTLLTETENKRMRETESKAEFARQ